MVRLQKDQASRIVDLENQLKNALASRADGFNAKVVMTDFTPCPRSSLSVPSTYPLLPLSIPSLPHRLLSLPFVELMSLICIPSTHPPPPTHLLSPSTSHPPSLVLHLSFSTSHPPPLTASSHPCLC